MDLGWLCQCKFINSNKCTAPVEDVDNGEGYAHSEQGVYGRSPYHPFSVAMNLKLLQKNNVF